MHTEASTPTEVAESKIAAARIVLSGALLELEAGNLVDAEDLVVKAGGKLIAASRAIEEAKGRTDTPWWSRARGGGS
jgi:hypothetical protein